MKFPFLHFRHHARFLILLFFLIPLLVLPPPSLVSAQTSHPSIVLSKEDSLRQQILTLRNLPASFERDTNLVKTLNVLAWELSYNNPDTALFLSNLALKIAGRLKWLIGIGDSHNNLGVFNRLKDNYKLALFHHEKDLAIQIKLKQKYGIVISLSNMGTVYEEQGEYPKAIDFYFKALKQAEEIGKKETFSTIFGNIGLVYAGQDDYPKALECYFNAINLDEQIRNNRGIARHYLNMGNVYKNMGDHSKAREFFFKALKLNKEFGDNYGTASSYVAIGNTFSKKDENSLNYYLNGLNIFEKMGMKKRIALCLGNIGIVYHEKKEYQKSLEYYHKALKIENEIGNINGVVRHLNNIGSLSIKIGRYKEAKEYLDSTLRIVEKINSKIGYYKLYLIYTQLFDTLAYLSTGNKKKSGEYYSLALTHYQKYLAVKDTIYNDEKSKSIGKLEARHEFALAEMERERKEKEDAVAVAATMKKRDRLQFMGITMVVVIVILIVALILFSKFKMATGIKTKSVFIALLLLFEFLLVWFDPAIEKFTGGDPVFKLLINAILALGFYFIQSGSAKLIMVPQKVSNVSVNSLAGLMFCIFFFVHLCAFASLRDTSFMARNDAKNVQKKFNAENAESKENAENTDTDSLKLLLTQYQSQVTNFQSQNKIKEAYEALKKYGAVKDSLQQHEQSQELARINEKHSIEIQKAKEKAVSEDKMKIEKAKKNRLNLLKDSGILIFIILLFVGISSSSNLQGLTRLVPGKTLKVWNSPRVLEGGLFVSFLLMFEFILVLFDPWIEQFTGGAPAWKMGFNVVIAVMISPVHSWLEQKMKRRLLMGYRMEK